MSEFPLQSQDAKFDEDGFEKVKTDLQQVATSLGDETVIHLSGPRVMIPRAGVVNIFLTSDTTTSSSSTAYHVITCLRSGQDETGISFNTNTNELTAYEELYGGQVKASRGSVISVDISVTGSPSPTLSNDNFTIRCELAEES